jgi:hypothetical protein
VWSQTLPVVARGRRGKDDRKQINWSRCMLATAIIIEGPMSRDFLEEVFLPESVSGFCSSTHGNDTAHNLYKSF